MSTTLEDLGTVAEADRALAELGPEPFGLPIHGLEHVVVGALRGLGPRDWWVPGLRERVGAVLRGVSVERLVDGFGGARPYHVAPPTPAPALRALHAVGLGMATPDRAVLVHLGIGSVADGSFYEALNLAALHNVRVIFVVAVHPLEGAPVPRQLATSPRAVAEAFGIAVDSVDGRDASAIEISVAEARQRVGPSLIEAHLSPNPTSPVEDSK